MAKTFVTEEEAKSMRNGCVNCHWAALPVSAFGRISKVKNGKCAWPVPPMPYMLDNCVAVTVRSACIWWNTGAGCPAWKDRHAIICRGCTNTVTQEHVDDWDGYCDDCIENGRNFDRGDKPPKGTDV